MAAHIYAQMNGWTALIWAAWRGRTGCMRLLLIGGSDKEAKSDVRVMRSESGSAHHHSVLNLVVSMLPAIHEVPLMPSCMIGLAVGDSWLCGQKGGTALICAAEYGHTECVRALLEAGADKDARNSVRHIRFVVIENNFLYSWRMFSR